jgi:hypothetical protein
MNDITDGADTHDKNSRRLPVSSLNRSGVHVVGRPKRLSDGMVMKPACWGRDGSGVAGRRLRGFSRRFCLIEKVGRLYCRIVEKSNIL